MLCMKAVKRVNPKSSHHKKKKFSISLILYLYEMAGIHETYCDNHFMMYVSQFIMLSTLNLYIAVCQLYLKLKEKTKLKSEDISHEPLWTTYQNLLQREKLQL